jgi:predicted nucleotidyltransferase
MENKLIKNIVLNFSTALLNKTQSEIHSIIWYGSTAKGRGNEDSDIDVAIIARNESDELWQIANSVAAKYSLEYDCLISILLISKERFETMKKNGRLLATNIGSEGKVVWQKEVHNSKSSLSATILSPGFP